MKISGDPAKLSAVFGRGSFIDRSFHLLSDYRDHFAAGTARTGHCAPRVLVRSCFRARIDKVPMVLCREYHEIGMPLTLGR